MSDPQELAAPTVGEVERWFQALPYKKLEPDHRYDNWNLWVNVIPGIREGLILKGQPTPQAAMFAAYIHYKAWRLSMTDAPDCNVCLGSGKVNLVCIECMDEDEYPVPTDCPMCHGIPLDPQECTTCQGTGREAYVTETTTQS